MPCTDSEHCYRVVFKGLTALLTESSVALYTVFLSDHALSWPEALSEQVEKQTPTRHYFSSFKFHQISCSPHWCFTVYRNLKNALSHDCLFYFFFLIKEKAAVWKWTLKTQFSSEHLMKPHLLSIPSHVDSLYLFCSQNCSFSHFGYCEDLQVKHYPQASVEELTVWVICRKTEDAWRHSKLDFVLSMQMVQLNQRFLDFLGTGAPTEKKGPPFNFNTDLLYAYRNQFNTTENVFACFLFYKGCLDQDFWDWPLTRVMESSICWLQYWSTDTNLSSVNTSQLIVVLMFTSFFFSQVI